MNGQEDLPFLVASGVLRGLAVAYGFPGLVSLVMFGRGVNGVSHSVGCCVQYRLALRLRGFLSHEAFPCSMCLAPLHKSGFTCCIMLCKLRKPDRSQLRMQSSLRPVTANSRQKPRRLKSPEGKVGKVGKVLFSSSTILPLVTGKWLFKCVAWWYLA